MFSEYANIKDPKLPVFMLKDQGFIAFLRLWSHIVRNIGNRLACVEALLMFSEKTFLMCDCLHEIINILNIN